MVWISQDMLFPGPDQSSRLPISLQKLNIHDINFHCIGWTRWFKMVQKIEDERKQSALSKDISVPLWCRWAHVHMTAIQNVGDTKTIGWFRLGLHHHSWAPGRPIASQNSVYSNNVVMEMSNFAPGPKPSGRTSSNTQGGSSQKRCSKFLKKGWLVRLKVC